MSLSHQIIIKLYPVGRCKTQPLQTLWNNLFAVTCLQPNANICENLSQMHLLHKRHIK